MNHSENCGKCHGTHWRGVDCKGKLVENWEKDLIDSGVAIIDLTQTSNLCYFGEPPNSINDGFVKYNKIACNFPWSSPNDLRKLGWSVAVHNDYKLNGENYTFWLMTKNNIALKGEGKTDEEALNKIREQILRDNHE